MAIVGDSTAVQTRYSASETAQKTKANDDLGKDAFLKLLITQLSNQDPLSPMDDTDFIAQMAQFSALEQMTNLNSSMSSMQASTMIGKFITWGENGEEVGGIVSATLTVNGETKLVVGNRVVKLNEVLSVTDQLTQAKFLVGKYVTWEENGQTVSGLVEGAEQSGGEAKLIIGDKKIALDQVIGVSESAP